MSNNELNEKIAEFEQAGWRYQYDGQGWSSGSWYHDQIGSVNNRGGSFAWIGDAVEALDRFIHNLERIC